MIQLTDGNEFFVGFGVAFRSKTGVHIGKVDEIIRILEQRFTMLKFEFQNLNWLAVGEGACWELMCSVDPDIENDRTMCAAIKFDFTRGNRSTYPRSIIDAANQLKDELDLVFADESAALTRIPYLPSDSETPHNE